ncbi:MAG TPA: hypothetical protein VK543_13690 [Puia sp.]|nr:hypothetical protein [Puia sp.]
MKQIIFLFILANSCTAFPQSIHWSKTSHWKLYDLKDQKGFSVSLDSLTHFKSIGLDDDSVRGFLEHATAWPKEKTAVWMGYFTVTCENGAGIPKKIELSMYGGFFYDETAKQYYQLPEEIRQDWLDFLNRKYDQLTEP